jgi:vacuolar protein 8
VSIHPANESPIIDSGFLQPLIELLSFDENEEVQCHAISTLRNLAASSERNKGAIVEAGAVERIKDLVLQVPLAVQSEMTACVAVLALSGELHLAANWKKLTKRCRRPETPVVGDGDLRSSHSSHQFAQCGSARKLCCCARKPVLQR